MSVSFKELVDLIAKDSVWVELNSGIRICLIAVHDHENEVFTGKYIPCAKNSRFYPVKYKLVKCVTGGKQ